MGGGLTQTERFPLTRYFVATGVITAIVVAAALALLTGQEVREDLLEEREDFAELIAANLNRQVHERFILPTVARDGAIDLDSPAHMDALDRVVRSSIAEFGIHTVYFFDLEGRIVYATNHEHRGFVIQDNPHYWRASQGTPSSALVERHSPLDVSGTAGGVPLLETYVPVHRRDAQGNPTAELSGVIEIYQDARELERDTQRASYRVALISSIGIVVLMLALWLWIRRAERTIDERTDALVDANASLAQLSHDLEGQVEDRSRRLLRAETLATVGTLSAGVAHEVNNPVAAIASCAEGLLRRTKASGSLREHPDFADFPEYLEIIRSEAFRVKGITRNLLDFSRQGSPLRSEPVELAALLEAARQLLAHRLEGEGKRMLVDAPEPVTVRGDGAGLRQLVLNLSVNAIDAVPAGGAVRWTLRATDEGAELSCQDDGPGFSEEDRLRALEPFYTQKPTGEGTGLGLSIAYGIAREHGGSLELTGAEPPPGARVVVRLPEEGPSE